MRRVRIKKLNNQGSTFVMAIIVITLVTILAVSILMASAHNISMKNVDRNSKDTFYTAETVMDEVRAGTGIDAVKQLGSAYEHVITTLIKSDATGFDYIIKNEDANKAFKEKFIDGMLDIITQSKLQFDGNNVNEVKSNDEHVRKAVKEYLEKFIQGYDDVKNIADIISVGTIEAYKDSKKGHSYIIIVRDVAIQYKEDKNGELYFSNVTTDFEIRFPNMEINFTATNRLDDFTKYAFIADNDIVITPVNVANKDLVVTSYASLYAGNIFDIKSSERGAARLYLQGKDTDYINIVCGGDNNIETQTNDSSGTIAITGHENYKAYLYTSNTNIWCTNIKIKQNFLTSGSGVDKSKGAELQLGGNAYVKDDLTINGQDSNVLITGASYYGYSYEGNTNHHSDSSAIIINGKRASFGIGVSKLVLAGHSYIDFGENSYQMMGESLSFRSNQDLYLVPSEYLGKNYGMPMSNPMTEQAWEDLQTAAATNSNIKICDMTNFFAWNKKYINTSKLYTVKKTANGLVYLYIAFGGEGTDNGNGGQLTEKKAIAKYIYDIANASDGAPNGLGNLHRQLQRYTASLFEGNSVIVNNPSSTIYSNGTLLTDSSGISGTLNLIDMTKTSLDLTNRYNIITHVLADIPWTVDGTANGERYYALDEKTALWDMKDYYVSGNELRTPRIFNFIVDESLINIATYNEEGITFDKDGKTYVKMITKADVHIPSYVQGGIIVSTGDVYVNNNFSGMIIAGGNIIMNNAGNTNTVEGIRLTNDVAEVHDLIKSDDRDSEQYIAEGKAKPTLPFKEYFYAFKSSALTDDSTAQVVVEKVNYKDIVKLNNWRKYED